MSKPQWIGGILGSFAFAGAVAYGIHYWQSSRPTKANLEEVARSIWTQASRTDGSYSFVAPRDEACLQLPRDTAPESSSKTRRDMSWHMDFLDQAAATPAREKHLAKLNALVSADLLTRQPITLTTPSGPQAAHRYRLSNAGWAATSYASQRAGACFVYARTRYLGTTGIEPLNTPNPQLQQDKVYKVTSRVGVASVAELQPWARDPQLMGLFPEIQQTLDGRDHVVLISRSQNKWVNHLDLLEARRYPERAARKLPSPTKEQIDDALEAMRKLPAPTPEELIGQLKQKHGHGKPGAWPGGCVPLPGSEKLPVDQKWRGTAAMLYRVAISNNIDRKPHDLVSKRTQPYLNRLEQLGVLVKVPDGAPGTYLATDFYELAPPYLDSLHRQHGDCLVLGAPQVEVVDLQIFEEDAWGMPDTAFQYKLRLTYPEHPRWMDDPVMLSQWTELKGLVERGTACNGKFKFDRQTREAVAGSGSCWPAFESVTDVQ
jgi:hypothetical protein